MSPDRSGIGLEENVNDTLGPADREANNIKELDEGSTSERVELGMEIIREGGSKVIQSTVPERGESPKDAVVSIAMEENLSVSNENDIKEVHGSVGKPKQHIQNVCILAEGAPTWLAVADSWGADLIEVYSEQSNEIHWFADGLGLKTEMKECRMANGEQTRNLSCYFKGLLSSAERW